MATPEARRRAHARHDAKRSTNQVAVRLTDAELAALDRLAAEHGSRTAALKAGLAALVRAHNGGGEDEALAAALAEALASRGLRLTRD